MGKRPRMTSMASWSKEDLVNAKDAIDRGMSTRKAAKEFNIPFTTLRERIRANNISSPSLGRKPIFNQQQEQDIVEQVKLLASLYYGITITDLRKFVYKYAELNGIKNNFDRSIKMVGLDWAHLFVKRNPSVAIRRSYVTGSNRISAVKREDIAHFYNLLGDLMKKHKFPPNNMYNADETAVTSFSDPDEGLVDNSQRKIRRMTHCERGRNITVMCAMSAAGNFIPPMFIFPEHEMRQLIEKNGPPGAVYAYSRSGWINEDIFAEWLTHFAAYAKPTQESPVLLILDNHSSHISFSTLKFCKENNIVVLYIPPQSSHRTQPLDVSFYGPLKVAYRQECNIRMTKHPTVKITPYDVAGLFNKAYTRAATVNRGKAGFRSTGICPLNPNVFTEEDYLAQSLKAQNSHQPNKMRDVNINNSGIAQSSDESFNQKPAPSLSSSVIETPSLEFKSVMLSAYNSRNEIRPNATKPPISGPSTQSLYDKQNWNPVVSSNTAKIPTVASRREELNIDSYTQIVAEKGASKRRRPENPYKQKVMILKRSDHQPVEVVLKDLNDRTLMNRRKDRETIREKLRVCEGLHRNSEMQESIEGSRTDGELISSDLTEDEYTRHIIDTKTDEQMIKIEASTSFDIAVDPLGDSSEETMVFRQDHSYSSISIDDISIKTELLMETDQLQTVEQTEIADEAMSLLNKAETPNRIAIVCNNSANSNNNSSDNSHNMNNSSINKFCKETHDLQPDIGTQKAVDDLSIRDDLLKDIHEKAFKVLQSFLIDEVIGKEKIFYFADIYKKYLALLLEGALDTPMLAENTFDDYKPHLLRSKIASVHNNSIGISVVSNVSTKAIVYKLGIANDKLMEKNIDESSELLQLQNFAYDVRIGVKKMELKKRKECETASIVKEECIVPEKLRFLMSALIKGPNYQLVSSNDDIDINSLCESVICAISKRAS